MHRDLELTEEQTELLKELRIDPMDLYPIRGTQLHEYMVGGTAWADPCTEHLVFVDRDSKKFLYYMGEENSELVCHHRGLTVHLVEAECLNRFPDKTGETEAA